MTKASVEDPSYLLKSEREAMLAHSLTWKTSLVCFAKGGLKGTKRMVSWRLWIVIFQLKHVQ
jgi:hypothetical protein